DRDDFIDGMNRVFIVCEKHNVIILAFCLMDTHVHFVLYGDFDECNRFMHDYISLTSNRIARRHSERHKLRKLAISHQAIKDDTYLKFVICYVLKNAPVGGLGYTSYDYPWGSGSLYFRDTGKWCAPAWSLFKLAGHLEASGLMNATVFLEATGHNITFLGKLSAREKRMLLNTRTTSFACNAMIIDGMIFPGEYVATEIVERIFKTHKSFNYFMCRTKEEDIEKIEGTLSRLSIPIQELRQHRNEICLELFAVNNIRKLTPEQRLHLVRTIKSRVDCSTKQICKTCGLIFAEVKDLI
ncbi:MAG: hypothetical protein IKT79_01330, partial [Akkermansia sp.]|nr:hypothetical protein [Akkermansia sp.]